MFTFSKRDGSLKQFKVKNVGFGRSVNDNEFTRFRISNKIGENEFEGATIFVWSHLELVDGDMVEITHINGFESKIDTWGGNQRIQTTLYASVNVIPSGNPQKPVEVLDALPSGDDNSDFLPF